MPLTYKLGSQWGQLAYPIEPFSGVITHLHELKMEIFRLDGTWNYAAGNFPGIEAVAGTHDAAAASTIAGYVAALKAAGIEPLINMDIAGEGSPQQGPLLASSWTSGAPCTPAQFAAAMGWVVAQSGLQGLRWELCNEPDYEGQDPVIYTEAVKLAYAAMKAADPTCTVHLGPVANINTGGGGYNFLAACYANGIKGYYDVMSFHLYTYPGNRGPDTTTGDGTLLSLLADLQSLRAANSDTTPLWLTETGWTWDDNGVVNQAQYLVQWLQELEGQGVEAVVQYDLYDYNGGAWGLADDQQVPRQSFYAVTELQSGPRFVVTGSSRRRL